MAIVALSTSMQDGFRSNAAGGSDGIPAAKVKVSLDASAANTTVEVTYGTGDVVNEGPILTGGELPILARNHPRGFITRVRVQGASAAGNAEVSVIERWGL